MIDKKRMRVIYFACFLSILVAEVLIALFVKDRFIRPYGGDILVTVLICSFIRMIFLYRIPFLPCFVFIFSFFVEVGQYFNFVDLLGLGDYRFFNILLGTSFSFLDIICYATGCILFWGIEKIILKKAS